MKSKTKTLGILAKTYEYGDSSLILKVFSIGHGWLSILAKGIRKKQERDLLGALNEYEFSYYEPREGELGLLSEFSMIQGHDFSKRLETWAIGESALELYAQFPIPIEESPVYYSLLRDLLSYIDSNEHNNLLVWWRFLSRIFTHLGIGFDPGTCELCGARGGALWRERYDPGRTLCRDCVGSYDPSQIVGIGKDTAEILELLPVIGNYLGLLTLRGECVRAINAVFSDHYRNQFNKRLQLHGMSVVEQLYQD